MSNDSQTNFLTALVAGGMAGTSVDVALFPIDTVKVRRRLFFLSEQSLRVIILL
jgi:hypothetical protein